MAGKEPPLKDMFLDALASLEPTLVTLAALIILVTLVAWVTLFFKKLLDVIWKYFKLKFELNNFQRYKTFKSVLN